jgi:hypothetical protein
MDQTKLNTMQLRARALAMAIRAHFRAASEGDAEVLEALASIKKLIAHATAATGLSSTEKPSSARRLTRRRACVSGRRRTK